MINVAIRQAKMCPGETSIYLSFPYDNRLVELVRSFPQRSWDKESKTWELPVKRLPELLDKLPNEQFEIEGLQYLEEATKSASKLPKNFQFKTNPFQHQIDGINYGLANSSWLLGDEQGLGKTKQAIDIACAKKLTAGYKHCLIVCGVNGLKWNWTNEIKTHSNEQSVILGQKKNGSIGSNADKLADAQRLLVGENFPFFIITNVETLRDDAIIEVLAKCCAQNVIEMVVIDEVHKCFDYNSLVITDVGDVKIGDIVTKNLATKVLSYNEETKAFEWKSITQRFENVIAEPFVELELETASGVKKIRCTAKHKFFTCNRGWITADELTSDDDIAEC